LTTTGDFEQLLTELDERERRLSAELDQLRSQQKITKQRMIARGRAYYRLVRAGLLPVGGGFEALFDHATQVERLRAALLRDLQAQEDNRKRQRQLQQQLQRTRAERGPLEVHRHAMQRAKVAMQQADERRASFQRAFGSQPGSSTGHFSVYGADPAPDNDQGSPDIAGRLGQLAFPLAGRAEVPETDTPQADRRGLQLRASRDTAVRAVAAGKVVYLDQYLHHGLTVVLDHGNDHFSLYGNLQRADVKLGQQLPARSHIGWVQRQGNRQPSLYFEFRRGGTAVDAAAWLGL